MTGTVNTVLGPVPADRLGAIAVHEALLSVVPGAEYAFDVTIDRAEIFAILQRKLVAFREAGGGAIVDAIGMFHGRDVRLYEALSRATGVHIVASTGMGPEEMLGGYFLTPQTNPPTPWPAERFARLFSQEIDEGMAVPRLERRAAAGLVATAADRLGMTATEESLFRAAARTSLATGVAASIRWGADPIHDLGILLDEGLPAERVVVVDIDRRDAVRIGAPFEVAALGAYGLVGGIGRNDDPDELTDRERVGLVRGLIDAGYADRILLSSNVVGVAKGHRADDLPYEYVQSVFVPQLRAAGVGDEDVRRITERNPRELLSLRQPTAAPELAAAGRAAR